MMISVHYKGKPMMLNSDHIIRVRNSLENESGSYIDFVGSAKQEVDETMEQVERLLLGFMTLNG